jgi:predicted dehydrogenase
MAPIRLALVGLTAKPGSYTWLNNVHLPYLQSNPRVKITAVLGSTKSAAEAAIAKFEMPSSVKAYGTAEELANDDNVDMVVVATKVHTHRDIVVPSIMKGKDVFVEWPLDVTFAGTKEITEMAKEKGAKTAVGLQGRYSAVVRRVKELVGSGKIGKVLSTTVVGTVPTGDGVSERASVKYSLSKGSGATMVDVHLAHFLEGFCDVLGEMESLSSVVATQHPTTDIVDDKTGEVIEKDFEKSAPDQVMFQGTLRSGAVASFHMRGGQSVAGGAKWVIYGTEGEIEVTGPALLLHINMGVPWKIRVGDGKGGVEEEEVMEDGARQVAVGKLWESVLKGEEKAPPDFEHAVALHGVVEGVYESSREGSVVRF